MTRDELIEKARAFASEPLPATHESYAQQLVHFCLPLLAQAREEALDAAIRICDDRSDEEDEVRAGDVWIVASNRLRALRRAPGETELSSPVTAEGTTGGWKEAKDTEAPRADPRQSATSSVSDSPDWADALVSEWRDLWNRGENSAEWSELAALLRERLAPCVEFVEARGSMYPSAALAIARLRGERKKV